MRFWDSSALVPLVVREARSDSLLGLFEDRPDGIVVWWGTVVECLSGLLRGRRMGRFTDEDLARSLPVLDALSQRWREVPPSAEVRALATRLLRVHDGLRAGDAFQLAAAVVASENRPPDLEMVCLDRRLREAALREGFRVLE